MIGTILGLAIGILFSAFCLWVGTKVINVDGNFSAMLVIAAISALFSLIPMIGWLVSIFVMCILLTKWTDADFWPDAVLIVIVANVVGMFAGIFLSKLVG